MTQAERRCLLESTLSPVTSTQRSSVTIACGMRGPDDHNQTEAFLSPRNAIAVRASEPTPDPHVCGNAGGKETYFPTRRIKASHVQGCAAQKTLSKERRWGWFVCLRYRTFDRHLRPNVFYLEETFAVRQTTSDSGGSRTRLEFSQCLEAHHFLLCWSCS